MKFIATALFAATVSLSASAFAITSSGLIGHNVDGAIAQRTINVDNQTRYINVQRGDIVKFVSGNNSVVWQFDGIDQNIPLSQIFPDAGAQDATVYVAVEDLH